MVKLNPKVVTDDMMYEGVELDTTLLVPTAEFDAWAEEYVDYLKEDTLWKEIRAAAKTNPTLQEAIDHVKMIYKLSKEYNNDI